MNSVLLASAKLLRASVAQLQRGLKVELPNGYCLNPRAGLCYNLEIASHVYEMENELNLDDLYAVWKHWPKYSGWETYPVPHPKFSEDYAFDFIDKWTGEYGSTRIELLDFIITELTKIEYPNK